VHCWRSWKGLAMSAHPTIESRASLESRTSRALDDAVQRELAERRLAALAYAVREHEARVRGQIGGPRPHDAALHRRLRQILAS
jgi:hypothetical protein